MKTVAGQLVKGDPASIKGGIPEGGEEQAVMHVQPGGVRPAMLPGNDVGSPQQVLIAWPQRPRHGPEPGTKAHGLQRRPKTGPRNGGGGKSSPAFAGCRHRTAKPVLPCGLLALLADNERLGRLDRGCAHRCNGFASAWTLWVFCGNA